MVSAGCETVSDVDTEVEVTLISVGTGSALSTISSAIGSFRRGREAKRAAKAAQLAEIDAAMRALLNEIDGPLRRCRSF